MTAANDPVAARLAGLRERIHAYESAATDNTVSTSDFYGQAAEIADRAGPLLAAVEAALDVLDKHCHKITDSKGECCAGCLEDWPCGAREAIAAAALSVPDADAARTFSATPEEG